MFSARSKQVLFALCVGCVLVVLGLLLYPSAARLKIYAILPLTGPAANAGIDVRDGLILAVDEINARGGLNSHHLEMTVLDGETSTEKSIEHYKKTKKGEKPLFYITITSRIASALAPLLEANEDLFFGLVATTPGLTAGKKWVYKFYTTPDTELAPVTTIVARLSVRRLGILYLQDDYGVPVFTRAQELMQQRGVEVVGAGFELGGQNLEARIIDLGNCDAVYVVGFQKHIMAAVPLIRKQLPEAKIITCNSTDTIFAEQFKELEGVYTAAPRLYDQAYPFARHLDTDFRNQFGRPVNHFAANGYDLIKMIASIMEDKSLSHEDIRKQFANGFLYPGVLGNLTVEPGGHDIAVPLYPAQLTGGSFQFFGTEIK